MDAATVPFPHRMRDVVRLTGVGAPTIHFWAQQGLLPAPRKTAGNQAVYAEATVTRIHWIRSIQNTLALPLRTIGWILERHGELAAADISALRDIGRLLHDPETRAPADEYQRVAARLDTDDIAELRNAGLVAANGDVTAADLRLLDTIADLRAAGFSREAGFDITGLGVYRDAVEGLVTAELRSFVEPLLTRGGSTEAIHELLRRGLPLTNRLLVLLHQRAVNDEIQRWLDADAEAQTAAHISEQTA